MSGWVRHEPLVSVDEEHQGPGKAFTAQWSQRLPDGTFGVVTRTFRPTETLGMACDTDYVACRDLTSPDDTEVWSNYGSTAWSDRVDEGSVRYAAEIAEPPSEKEWAEAVAGAVVAS